MKKIVVVDDDARLRDLLNRFLTEQGYKVTALADARELAKTLSRDPPHLIVLDVMMPGQDGFAVCAALRAQGDNTPVIMLTAKGSEDERIEGLNLGADDYLPKPFNPRELLARISAVLRRHAEGHAPGAPEESGEVVFGAFTLDLGARQLHKLTEAGRETISITTGEFSVLKVLATHPKQSFTRDKLMHLARGREQESFDRAIDVQISRLRKLIEPNPAKPIYIQTVWGHGYVFVPDAVSDAA
jgi:two-component system, OmpR family, phosphate regulon response regulator OmpR